MVLRVFTWRSILWLMMYTFTIFPNFRNSSSRPMITQAPFWYFTPYWHAQFVLKVQFNLVRIEQPTSYEMTHEFLHCYHPSKIEAEVEQHHTLVKSNKNNYKLFQDNLAPFLFHLLAYQWCSNSGSIVGAGVLVTMNDIIIFVKFPMILAKCLKYLCFPSYLIVQCWTSGPYLQRAMRQYSTQGNSLL